MGDLFSVFLELSLVAYSTGHKSTPTSHKYQVHIFMQ